MPKKADVGACALIAAAVWLLYYKALRLWWMFDDAYHLHTVTTHRTRDFFTEPAIWRAMPNRLFTPILQASYSAELSLFGLQPARFYAVHLAELMLAGIVVYAALRLWVGWMPALGGAVIFIAGPPMASVGAELYVMHYLEAVILGGIAAIAYVAAVRQGSTAWSVVSAVFYLAAMLAKEIAVPLPAFLVLLPGTRPRHLVPHAAALAVYTAWRRAMLGELFGGYGWVLGWPRKLGAVFLGPHVVLGVLLLAAIGASIALSLRGKRLAVLAVALVLAIAPIVPFAREMQPRFAVAAWLVLAAAVAVASQSRRGAALLVVVVALTLAVHSQAWAEEMRRARRMSEEARFYFDELPPDGVLRDPLVPPAAMFEVRWLRENLAHRGPGATWFYDDYFPCTHDLGARPVWSYDPARHHVIRWTARPRVCAAIRTAPLSADLTVRGDAVFWHLGPYADGQYRFLIADGAQAFDVPRDDGFHLPGVDVFPLRVGYRSPAGWVTYSPELTVDVRRQIGVLWRR